MLFGEQMIGLINNGAEGFNLLLCELGDIIFWIEKVILKLVKADALSKRKAASFSYININIFPFKNLDKRIHS